MSSASFGTEASRASGVLLTYGKLFFLFFLGGISSL